MKIKMTELEKVKEKYKNLILKEEQNNKENYIHLTKEKMWYLADDTDTNIQNMVHANNYVVCEEIEPILYSIHSEIKDITGINDYWDLIMKEFYQIRDVDNSINDILDDVCKRKFNGMNSDEWYNANNEAYMSYSDMLKFQEITELAYLYECYSEMFWDNIYNFNSQVKYNCIYTNIKKQLDNIIESEYRMASVLEMAYYICQMLAIDFLPIAKKFKQFNNSHKLIRFRDRKDIMQDA